MNFLTNFIKEIWFFAYCKTAKENATFTLKSFWPLNEEKKLPFRLDFDNINIVKVRLIKPVKFYRKWIKLGKRYSWTKNFCNRIYSLVRNIFYECFLVLLQFFLEPLARLFLDYLKIMIQTNLSELWSYKIYFYRIICFLIITRENRNIKKHRLTD